MGEKIVIENDFKMWTTNKSKSMYFFRDWVDIDEEHCVDEVKGTLVEVLQAVMEKGTKFVIILPLSIWIKDIIIHQLRDLPCCKIRHWRLKRFRVILCDWFCFVRLYSSSSSCILHITSDDLQCPCSCFLFPPDASHTFSGNLHCSTSYILLRPVVFHISSSNLQCSFSVFCSLQVYFKPLTSYILLRPFAMYHNLTPTGYEPIRMRICIYVWR